MQILDLSISSLHKQYRSGILDPSILIDYILERCQDYQGHNIWIHLMSRTQIAPYLDRIRDASPDTLPLFGIPFAIKDNIDLAGVPTTAACPQFTYIPDQSAFVVQQILNAGAIPVGKTNMDQFATGLTGTRSPYGAVKNSINPDYISGGSSSGSAVSTALGLVSFALGTDTAGSGRVPAMFNNLVGVKPGCGIVSSRGVVPACRSLDCVSLFALNPDDAERVYSIMDCFDSQDSYAKAPDHKTLSRNSSFRFGTLPAEQFQADGDVDIPGLMEQMTDQLISLGGIPVQIDFNPFCETARLLYEGPWVAERYAAIKQLISSDPDALHPVTRKIIEGAEDFTAVDTFQAMYRLRELKQQADRILSTVDFIITPTASNIFTINAVEGDPIKLNSQLGYYTNFMNLLEYSAVAIPAGHLSNGMPFGVTLFADNFETNYLLRMSRLILAQSDQTMGANRFKWQPETIPLTQTDPDTVDLLVCGAHLSGMPLNHQLLDLGATLVKITTTAADYRLYALVGGPPLRPALVRDVGNGARIDVEIWSMSVSKLGRFLQQIPVPLGLGKVKLVDSTEVIGFICEPCGLKSALDITDFGGWKNYIQSLNK